MVTNRSDRVDRGQSVPGRKRDDQIAMNNRRDVLAGTIRPPFGSRANAAMPRSISPASRTVERAHLHCRIDGATALDGAELADPRGMGHPEGLPLASRAARSL